MSISGVAWPGDTLSPAIPEKTQIPDQHPCMVPCMHPIIVGIASRARGVARNSRSRDCAGAGDSAGAPPSRASLGRRTGIRPAGTYEAMSRAISSVCVGLNKCFLISGTVRIRRPSSIPKRRPPSSLMRTPGRPRRHAGLPPRAPCPLPAAHGRRSPSRRRTMSGAVGTVVRATDTRGLPGRGPGSRSRSLPQAWIRKR